MEPGGDFLSPESTVTSLLSSSGQLRSGTSAHRNDVYTYKDKVYDSASGALDAYIADFNRSCQKTKWSSGRLVLPTRSPLSTPGKAELSMLRNRDVLTESLTVRELDYLNLPVRPLPDCDNRDRLSMATEDLLSFPCDGTMPVTHTSAFIQGLMSRSALSRSCSPARVKRRLDRVMGNHSASQLVHHRHRHHHPGKTSRGLNPSMDMFQGADRVERLQSSSRHLPHWFTSHREELDCSELGSVPELRYPAWICCELGEDPATQPRPRSQECALSSVSQLDEADDRQEAAGIERNQMTATDLVLQFAQSISATHRKPTSVATDHRIESLIHKADQVLDSLHKSSRGAAGLQESSPDHLDLVSSAAAGDGSSAGDDLYLPSLDNSLKQPGPVEALKQMLFRLQLVEAELHRQQHPQPTPSVPHKTEQTQEDDVGEEQVEDR